MNYKTLKMQNGTVVQITGSFTFRDHDTFFEVVSMIKTAYEKKMILSSKQTRAKLSKFLTI